MKPYFCILVLGFSMSKALFAQSLLKLELVDCLTEMELYKGDIRFMDAWQKEGVKLTRIGDQLQVQIVKMGYKPLDITVDCELEVALKLCLEVEVSYDIIIEVFDKENKHRIEGALVEIKAIQGTSNLKRRLTTDSDGFCNIERLPPNQNYEIVITKELYLSEKIELETFSIIDCGGIPNFRIELDKK